MSDGGTMASGADHVMRWRYRTPPLSLAIYGSYVFIRFLVLLCARTPIITPINSLVPLRFYLNVTERPE